MVVFVLVADAAASPALLASTVSTVSQFYLYDKV